MAKPRTVNGDAYDYIRRVYRVPAYIGVLVRCGTHEGRIVKQPSGDAHYLYIVVEDQRIVGPFHPTDHVDYLFPAIELAQATRLEDV